MMSSPSGRVSRLALAATLGALTLTGVGSAAATTAHPSARAATPHTATAHTATPHTATAHTTSGNPLAAAWGVYKATTLDNPTYRAYASSSGTNKQLLARIALRPRAQWFGSWQESSRIGTIVSNYIANIKAQNKNAIAMMTMFPIKNWEIGPQSARKWSAAYIADYKRWIDNAARAIGRNRVMIVEQPDLIYATKNDRPSVPLSMIRYAAKAFGTLPHTTVYLDAGSRDYKPNRGVSMVKTLKSAGIQYTRGFSLNDTHHDATNLEIGYGNTLAAALAKARLPHHFVVNTSSNGTPSTGGQLPTNKDAPACANRSQKLCLALGLPPTYKTDASHWGISNANKAIARRLVDGFVWVDRPWLIKQSQGSVYQVSRSLNLGRATPYIAFVTKSPTRTYDLTRARKQTFVVHNGSTTQNLTVDFIRFTNVKGTKPAYGARSTCRTGSIVAPGKSCTAVVAYAGSSRGSAYLRIATNTANEWYRRVSA